MKGEEKTTTLREKKTSFCDMKTAKNLRAEKNPEEYPMRM